MVTMMKENIESGQAVHLMSKFLHKASNNINIAGNKDKRGITTQWVSIAYGNQMAIWLAVKKPEWNKQIKLGDLT